MQESSRLICHSDMIRTCSTKRVGTSCYLAHPHHGVGVDGRVARGEQHAVDARVDRRLDHMLGLEGVGLDRLDGVLLDHVDVPHRRGMHDDVDVGHRVPQAGRIADVASEEPTAVVV